MDGTSTTFGKKHGITISRGSASIILALFIGCLVGTGLLVYNFSSSCPRNNIAGQIPLEIYTPNNVTVTDNIISSSTEAQTSTIESTTSYEENITREEEKIDVRLPKSLVPDYYEIHIIPFIFEGNFTFHGVVDIIINVTEVTSDIKLHVDDIAINQSSLTVKQVLKHNGSLALYPIRTIPIREISNDTERQFLVISLNEDLQVETQYSIHIEYKGILNDILQGFYRSSYISKNQTRYLFSNV